MTIIDAATAPVFALEGIKFTGLAAPSRGATENAVWKLQVAPGTPPGPPHQLTREETFVAIAGTADVYLAGQSLSLSAGSALIVPADTDFALGNSGDTAFEAVVVLPVGGQALVPNQPAFVPPWAL